MALHSRERSDLLRNNRDVLNTKINLCDLYDNIKIVSFMCDFRLPPLRR